MKQYIAIFLLLILFGCSDSENSNTVSEGDLSETIAENDDSSSSGDDTDDDSTSNTESNDDEETTTTTPVLSDIGSTRIVVELGRVAEAQVQLFTLGGQEIASFSTDENGEYSLERAGIKTTLEGYGLTETDFIYFSTTGGTDTDPDDDGDVVEEAKVAVNGSLQGIMQFSDFLTSEEIRINLISTTIFTLFGENKDEKISEKSLARISEQLGVYDINNDGTINNKDVYQYDMVNNESRAESFLKYNGVLSAIHQGDLEDLETKMQVVRNKMETGIFTSRIHDSSSYITLFTLEEDKNIKFSKNGKSKDGSFYSNEEIELTAGEFVAYKECDIKSPSICKSEQVVFFSGDAILDYYPESGGGNFTTSSDVEKMQKELMSQMEILRDSMKAIENNNNGSAQMQAEIDKINDQIRELEEQAGTH